MKMTLQSLARAFTLVEILAVVAGIAILAGSGYVVVTNVTRTAAQSKLESDVHTINRAIGAYQASGGNLTGVTGVGDLLDRLKTSVSADDSSATMGLRSNFLDKRIKEVSPTGPYGAVWNSASSRLEIVAATTAGSRQFEFDESLALQDYGTDDRTRTKDVAVEAKWVWDFSDTGAPTTTTAPEPTTGSASLPTGTIAPKVTLSPPNLSPPGGAFSLFDFDPTKPVTITNPNPAGSSQVYYSTGGAYMRYTAPVQVPPGGVLTAVAISQDPEHYINSSSTSETYNATPIPLTVAVSAPGDVTYQQAGGPMTTGTAFTAPPITVTMTASVPGSYANQYEIRYTLDGSNPAQSGTPAPLSGGVATIPYTYASWGGAASLVVKAVAISSAPGLLVDSGVNQASIATSKVTLQAPTITPATGTAGDTASIALQSGAPYPTAFSLVINGPEPDSPTQTSPVSPTNIIGVAAGELTAFVAAPTLTNWFNQSPATSATFETGSSGTILPAGVLVGGFTLTGSSSIQGSVTVSAEHEGDIPMGGSTRINGNLYLPSSGNFLLQGSARVMGNVYVQGTPELWRTYWPVVSWSPATDGNFATFIKGNEYDASGQLVSPSSPGWSPSPRVIDLAGDANPTNYKITFGGSTRIDGKVYRRIGELPTLPTVAEPPGRDNNLTRTIANNGAPITINPSAPTNNEVILTVSGSGQPVTLKAGNYGDVKVQASREIILGDADNPNVVQKYSFESLQISGSSKVTVVGKVEITINFDEGGKFSLSGSTSLGNSAHPEYVQLNIYTSDAADKNEEHVSITGASRFYGQINAPKGLVTIAGSSSFRGSVTAYHMDATGASSGTVQFDLPPITD